MSKTKAMRVHDQAQNWRSYQEAAAEYFRSLGLRARVQHKLQGARGHHEIDVHVTGDYMGIEFTWLVECKAWKTNVPKEKVVAFAGIIQDVGADRGFLLSEKGFQSGAIRASDNSNISLTSLADLSMVTSGQFVDFIIGRLHWGLTKAQNRLRNIKTSQYNDDCFPPTMEPLGRMSLVDISLEDALKNEYPIIYLVEDGVRHSASTLEELIKGIDALITHGELWTPR